MRSTEGTNFRHGSIQMFPDYAPPLPPNDEYSSQIKQFFQPMQNAPRLSTFKDLPPAPTSPTNTEAVLLSNLCFQKCLKVSEIIWLLTEKQFRNY